MPDDKAPALPHGETTIAPEASWPVRAARAWKNASPTTFSLASLVSPAIDPDFEPSMFDLFVSALGPGTSAMAARGLLGAPRLAQAIEAGMQTPLAASALQHLTTSDDTPQNKVMGLLQAALAARGLHSAAVNQGFAPVRYGRKEQVWKAAREANPTPGGLSSDVPAELYRARTGENLFYGLSPSPVSPQMKDLVGVMNNDPYARGQMPRILRDATARGAETLNAWSVPSEKFPEGRLPTLYERGGFEPYKVEGYDVKYGRPDAPTKGSWVAQGWKPGDPIPSVTHMVHPATRPAARTIPRFDPAYSDTSAASGPPRTGPDPLVPGALQRPETALEHRSPTAGLTRLDPSYFGTAMAGEERRRAATYPEVFVPRTYFTRKGGAVEPRFQKMRDYESSMTTDRLYDIGADPWEFRADAKKAAGTDPALGQTLLEKFVKDAGFAGYFNSTAERAISRDAIALFEPVTARKPRKMPKTVTPTTRGEAAARE